MLGWIRKALRGQVTVPAEEERNRRVRTEEIPPSERLVATIGLTIVAIILMTVLEIVHVIYLGTWNSEIFSGIMGLIGLVLGTLVGAKA